MKSKSHKKHLTWMLITCMLVTLLPSTVLATGLPAPSGLKIGIGETEKTFSDGSTATVHYACCDTTLGLHFDEVPGSSYYRWDLEKHVVLPNGSTMTENGGGSAVYPYAHLFMWRTLNGANISTRDIDSITIAFEDDNGNKGPASTLNTDITVTQIESNEPVTAYYIGTEQASWSSAPGDKESTFKISGLPANHSVYFGNPQKSGVTSVIGNGGILEIKDSCNNGEWNMDLGDLSVDAGENYYLDIYKTTVTSNTKADLEITRHPVNFVFNGFDITIGGALTYNNGNQITPAITVKTTDSTPVTLTEGTDYDVTFQKSGTGIAASEVKTAGTYTAVITGKAGTAYEGKLATKAFTIAKATPIPPAIATGLTAVYGQALADISLPSGLSWQDAAGTAVGNAGNNTFKAQYNPDPENYNSVTGIDVSITVSKANQTKPVLSLSSETGLFGLTAPTLTLTGGGGTGALHYESSNPDIATIDEATGAITIVAKGTTTFTVTKAGDSNYNESELSDEVLLVIKDKIDLTLTDTTATDASVLALLKNQGQINVGAPIRTGLSNEFTVAVSGKTTLATYAGNDSQEAKWIGLLIGNFRVNAGSAYPVTNLFYKISDDTSADYIQFNPEDVNGSLQSGGTDKEFVYQIRSDMDPTKVIWLATSASGENETKLTVNFTPYTVPSHNGGGSSGSSSPSTPTTPTDTKATEKETATISASVSASTDEKGNASITVPSKTIADLIEKALAAEEKNKSAVIKINVKMDAAASSSEVKIEKAAFTSIIKETTAKMSIETGLGTITFDEKALETIGKASDSDISIRMEAVDRSTLSDETNALVGAHPVYDMTVLSGDKKISSFDGGAASISIPYALKSGEDENAIVVYYLSDDGTLQTIRGAYNSKTGSVDFVVSHFSQYAVGYNKVSYSDVSSNSWYAEAVTFLSARGISSGTSETTFSPNKAITRGEFIVMLLRAYGIDPKENSANNFIDAGDTYYTDYLASAKELNITKGTGNDLYQPNSQISRQDMITMLYRALDTLEELPEQSSSVSSVDFDDDADIASYAKSSIDVMSSAGIISGSNGKVDPMGQSTRAQMAQILYNLLSE